MFPLARSEKLTIHELPDEVLIYDHLRAKAHCLNRTSYTIWKQCDGRTDPATLAGLLGMDHAEAIVDLALEQLAQRHLLQGPLERVSSDQRRSRRDVLKKLAAAAATLPIILTVAAPKASATGSLSCTSNDQCASLTANGGCVVGTCMSGRCTLSTAANGTVCSNGGLTGLCSSGACVTNRIAD